MTTIEWWRDLLRERGGSVAIALGVVMGLAAVIDVRLPILGLAFVSAVLIGLYYPALIVPVLFAAILAEDSGQLGAKIAGLPITTSKLVVLGMLGVVLIRSIVERQALASWLPTSAGYVAVIASMVFGVGVAGQASSAQLSPTLGVIMLAILAHVIPRLLGAGDLRWVIPLMTGIALFMLLSNLSAETVESTYQERYSGAFLDANMWALSLLLISPLCIAYAAEQEHPAWAVLLMAMFALVLLNVFQSLSRAGLLALVAVSPTLVWLMWRRRVAFGIAVVLTLVLISGFVSTEVLVERYSTLVDPDLSESDGSLQLRSLLAKTALDIFFDHPVFGTGQGTFMDEAIRYTNGAAYMVTHNTYLNIAAELGIVGLVAHAYFYYLVVKEGVQAALRAQTRRLQRLIAGYGAGMLAFALMSMTLNNMQFAMAFFMAGVGTVLARASHLSREELDRVGLGQSERVTDESPGRSAAA